jgi:hypothetical protein
MTEANLLCERCGAPVEERARENREGGAACPGCGAEVPVPAPSTATPTSTSTATPAATPAPANDAADDEAWAAVLARWEDEEPHHAFLARFGDLAGLAEAGRRYREVLAGKPGDPVALRWRDEIVRRATAQGLMQLPRTSPPAVSPKLVRWAVLAGMIGAGALAAGWMAWRLFGLARS